LIFFISRPKLHKEVPVGADQVAVIRPLVVEVEDGHAEQPNADYCARFDVPGRDAALAEVVHNAVNFAYPFADDPIERLGHLRIATLPGLALLTWQPGLYATVSLPDRTPSRDVARFVDAILGILLGCGDDYPLDAEIDRLDNGGARG
jgi:hypothetical protein